MRVAAWVCAGLLLLVLMFGCQQPHREPGSMPTRAFDGPYSGANLNRIAFPLGGIGAGMVCLEGTGALSHVSIRNKPDVYFEPAVFAAVCLKGVRSQPNVARVLEGPVPGWKLYGPPDTGNGGPGRTYGLPRLAEATFRVRFPFGSVELRDPDVPLRVTITGWSPFEPGDADNSSLPVAGLEYELTYTGRAPIDAVFSFNARNLVATGPGQAVRAIPGGFVLEQPAPPERPHEATAFCIHVTDPAARVNAAWFRGGWWDPLTIAWRDVEQGACYEQPAPSEGEASPGATVFVPLRLEPGKPRKVTVQMSWYAGLSDLRIGKPPPGAPAERPPYQPWYSGRFADIGEVAEYWEIAYDALRASTARFSECFHDTTLPPEAIEAVAANLTILKSPTVLRQADGRLWGWEGCSDRGGCCHGSCTHVWNYAQAIPHLFPALERTLRETEFEVSQDERGHQAFRTALPIAPQVHDFHAAADGQLGGILKVYREWRIGGDTEWLRRLWPRVRASLDYCIATWDPERKGVLSAPHHNTYDIEFWGPDGMCGSFYEAALAAAVRMGVALGDDVAEYARLREAAGAYLERELWNGEYFVQKVTWRELLAREEFRKGSGIDGYSPEARALLEREGPKYQYGDGCLADGVLGAWLAAVCGLDVPPFFSGHGDLLDPAKVASHVQSVHRYNLRRSLRAHANPQRPTYACGDEGGLLLCTWPHGNEPALPFVYSDEVWTGIEYQVASHLMLTGQVDAGLEIVRLARQRYDGRVRNPFDEYECGHWYARAMSSYALLGALSGARYDAVDHVLHLRPAVRGDFRAFLSTATGYGTVGVRGGRPFVEVAHGTIPYERIEYTPAAGRR